MNPAPLIQPIRDLFGATTVAMWCTTYNADLSLFAEYLFRRLGDPPLNTVVLMDGAKLNGLLQRTDPDDLRYVSANTQWLLRGQHNPHGRFHPKTYLSATSRKATLLVGSGNLTMSGLDSGREVFTSFSTTNPQARSVVARWLEWVRRLVPSEDVALLQRYFALEQLLRPMLDDADTTGTVALVHDLDEAIHTQFVKHVRDTNHPVRELTISTPFFDPNGQAIVDLIHDLKPESVRLVLTPHIQVKGEKLLAAIESTDARLRIFRYEPDDFTHAKLIAASSDHHAWLLTGSVNATIAGLGRAATNGNTEIAVITDATPEAVESVLAPPATTLEVSTPELLASLTYEPDPDTDLSPQISVLSARRQPDQTIHLTTATEPPSDIDLSNLIDTFAVSITGTTVASVQPVAGQIVVLLRDGEEASNRILVDDPMRLDSVLHPSESSERSTLPAELDEAAKDTIIGRGLGALHRTLIMDATEVATATPGIGAEEGEATPDTADELWERLERESLQVDPRVGNVSGFGRRTGTATSVEGIIELLDALRDQAPDTLGSPGVLHPVPLMTQDPEAAGTGRPWSLAARVRVRAKNVLSRWAAAQSDQRLLWVDPMAPIANTSAVMTLLVRLWIEYTEYPEPELSPGDLDEIWAQWFDGLLGTPGQIGWLERATEDSDSISDYVTDEFRESVTLLTCLALRPVANRRTIITWQPRVQAAQQASLLQPTPDVARALATVVGTAFDTERVTGILESTESYVDDELWGDITAKKLGLVSVRIAGVDTGQDVSARLNVEGIANPLSDARVPKLIEAARVYRDASGIVVFGLDNDWRLSVTEHDESLYLNHATGDVLQGRTVHPGEIESLARNDGFVADFFTI